MATAFQASAFQNDSFQIDEVIVEEPIVSFLHDGGGAISGARKRHYRSAAYVDLLEKIRREGKRLEPAPALAPTLAPAEPIAELSAIDAKSGEAVAAIIRDAQAAAELELKRIQDDEAIALLLLV